MAELSAGSFLPPFGKRIMGESSFSGNVFGEMAPVGMGHSGWQLLGKRNIDLVV